MSSQVQRHMGQGLGAPKHGRFCPVMQGWVTLLGWMCSPTWKLPEPCTAVVLWSLPHRDMADHSLTSTLIPFQRVGAGLNMPNF